VAFPGDDYDANPKGRSLKQQASYGVVYSRRRRKVYRLLLFPSVSESEVQPLVSLILRVLQILMLLILTHRTPDRLSSLIAPSVVKPSENEQQQSEDVDAKEHAISAVVTGLVIVAVDVGGDHTAHLHHHVVAGGGDGTSAHATCVAGRETDEDGVAVGVAE
jgi:hypothetical protein